MVQAQDDLNPVYSDEQWKEKEEKRINQLLEELQLHRSVGTVENGGWGCVIPVYHDSNPTNKVAFKIS